MDKQEIIKKTETFVKENMGKDSTGHDWWHVHRVRNLAKRIARHEDADIFIPVGGEAESFIPLRKELSDKDFEQKVKETFGI